ncbi:MAG: FAD-dependent oxidoreductase [Frankia sp.]|nr:FAD-dependent oxidoreductase [Frankia sp.]
MGATSWSTGGRLRRVRHGARGGPGVGHQARRPRVVVVGGGFAGLTTARRLESLLPADAAELVLVSPVDHLLYTSLLPQVAASAVEPRHIAVAIRSVLRRTVAHLGHATAVDARARTVTVVSPGGERYLLGYDRLVLASGAVTHLPSSVAGLAEHAFVLHTLADAAALRDHVLRQLEHADTCSHQECRAARMTFVVVGAGYTGTELAAQMMRFTHRALPAYPRLRAADVRWLLVDHGQGVLHELGPGLGRRAARVLASLGVEVRLGVTAQRVTPTSIRLASVGGGAPGGFRGDATVGTHTVVWCAGVRPSPLIDALGWPTTRGGRLVVDAYLRVPSVDDVFALGDAAAVPDLTRAAPGGRQGAGAGQGAPTALTGQTAQHAVRQAAVAARNVAASLGYGRARPYRHHNLGFVVDLGDLSAVANPLGVPLAGRLAALVTRGYHLVALPTAANRARVATDWLLDAVLPEEITELGQPPLEPHPGGQDLPLGAVPAGPGHDPGPHGNDLSSRHHRSSANAGLPANGHQPLRRGPRPD